MMYLPEDINNLCDLLIEHYGQAYINDWDTLSALLKTEFDIEIPANELALMRLDITSYLDITKTLTNCGINL